VQHFIWLLLNVLTKNIPMLKHPSLLYLTVSDREKNVCGIATWKSLFNPFAMKKSRFIVALRFLRQRGADSYLFYVFADEKKHFEQKLNGEIMAEITQSFSKANYNLILSSMDAHFTPNTRHNKLEWFYLSFTSSLVTVYFP